MKTLFIHIPKCAGLAMRELYPVPYGYTISCTHFTLNEWEDVLGWSFQNYRTMTVVRHPCDRFVSAFSYLKQQDESHPYWDFDKAERDAIADYVNVSQAAYDARYLRDLPHFKPMTHWGADRCEMVLRYEHLAKTMPRLERTNSSRHMKWQQELTHNACVSLADAYSDDFWRFNYNMEDK